MYSATTEDDFFDVIKRTAPAFADVEDFVSKATMLARKMKTPAGSLRAEHASALARYVGRMRRWLRAGTNPHHAVDDAISAALILSALCAEIREDSKVEPVRTRDGKVSRRKVTRAAYLAAKQVTGGKKAAMARMLDLSERGLRKWERENLS